MKKQRFIVYIIAILIIVFASKVFPSDSITKDSYDVWWTILLLLFSGMIGYVVGTVKSFREEKQRVYGELLPPIIKMAYNPEPIIDEKEFNEALSKLWLYGSKKVTKKMDYAVSILHDHSGGDITKALQEAVVEMRKDIQVWSCQRLTPEDVHHLYTRIRGGVKTDSDH